MKLPRRFRSDNRPYRWKRRYAARAASARIERVLFEDDSGGRCGDEAHQRLGGISLLRPGRNAGGEHRDQLDLGGQRTDIVDAGKEAELAHLLKADLDLAIGDDAADEHAGRGLLELGL